MLDFGVVQLGALLVFAGIWIGAMARRWRRDLCDFREAQGVDERLAIACLWSVTLLLVAWVLATVAKLFLGSRVG